MTLSQWRARLSCASVFFLSLLPFPSIPRQALYSPLVCLYLIRRLYPPHHNSLVQPQAFCFFSPLCLPVERERDRTGIGCGQESTAAWTHDPIQQLQFTSTNAFRYPEQKKRPTRRAQNGDSIPRPGRHKSKTSSPHLGLLEAGSCTGAGPRPPELLADRDEAEFEYLRALQEGEQGRQKCG